MLHGLLSFPLTPFTDVDTVDLDVFAEHIEQQIAAGPSGLFVACGTGEFTALSESEYRDVVHTAVQTAAGRLPVYAGTGGGPKMARAFASAAAGAGADGLLLLPPYLVGCTPAGLVRHIAYVASGTDLPIVIYQRANAVLDAASAVSLLDMETVIGIKDGNGDVDAMQRIVTAVRTCGHPRAEGFGFLNGLPTAELSVAAYRGIGIDGYSSAALCFVPDIAGAFRRAVEGEDAEAAQTLLAEFYLPFAELRDRVPGYAVSLVKAGARLGGLGVGATRPPLVDPTDDHLARLAEVIERGRAALARLGRAAA